jgi:AP-3 complex subunit delta-1
LNPVAPKAQKKVPVPEGLDLDAWINEPPSESEDEATVQTEVFVKGAPTMFGEKEEKQVYYEPTEEEMSQVE